MMKQHKNDNIRYSIVVGEYSVNGVKHVLYQDKERKNEAKSMPLSEYQKIKHNSEEIKQNKEQRIQKRREDKQNKVRYYNKLPKQLLEDDNFDRTLKRRLMSYSKKIDSDISYISDVSIASKKHSLKILEKYKPKFMMMLVKNTFNEATSDTTVVKNLIKDYFNNRFKYLIGLRITIDITFLDSTMRYRSHEMLITENNKDDFFKELDNQIVSWQIAQAKYDDKYIYSCDGFDIWIDLSIPVGGCFNNKVEIKGLRRDRLYKMIYTPMNKKDNNCIINCLLYAKNATLNNRGNLKVHAVMDDIEECQKIRDLYYDHQKPIQISELEPLSKHFESSIKIYGVDKNKIILVETVGKYKNVVNILLVDYHYHLITNKTLTNLKYCHTCCNYFDDIEEHQKDCHYCSRCRRPYSGTHTKSDCEENLNTVSYGTKSVQRVKEDKVFNATNHVIYSDFETIVIDGVLVPYACAFAIDDGKTTIYEGQDALDKFIDDMLKLKGEYTLVYYNGSRFDCYFVYNNLVKRNIQIDNVILANGSYKKFTFNGISVFDLNLHLTGSLRSNCKAFGVEADKSKGEFDHKLIKEWSDVEKYHEQWYPYLELDIISMRELYKKYSSQVWNDLHFNTNKFITVSSLAEKAWKTTLKERLILPTYDEDCFIRRSIYGGRTYMNKQFFESQGEDDYLLDCDVVSLYPSAMVYEYPCGEMTKIEEPKQLEIIKEYINKDSFNVFKYYFLECDIITNKKLVNAVIPRRDGDGLHWDLFDIKDAVYNSIDIKRAVKHGYKVTQIHRIYGFKKGQYVFKEYIEKVFQLKKRAVKDTPQYALAKLLMNALFGKMCQRPIIEQSKLISTYEELESLRQDNEIVGYHEVNNDKLLVTYIPFELDKKVNKASYLGSFILGYSRMIMDKYIDAIDGYTNIEKTFFRTDTDSLIVHRNQYETFQELGYMQKGVLGMLSLDINGKIVKYAEIAPKVYCCRFEPFDEEGVEDYKKDAKKGGCVWEGGNRFLHIRAKSFSKADQHELTMNDYECMLFGKKNEGKQQLYDSFNNNYGFIQRNNDEILLHLDDRLKKNGLKLNGKQKERGIEFSSITSELFERKLNKTKWCKRDRIDGHKYLASLPKGYEGKANGINPKLKFK